jgi:hypothetical protein
MMEQGASHAFIYICVHKVKFAFCLFLKSWRKVNSEQKTYKF